MVCNDDADYNNDNIINYNNAKNVDNNNNSNDNDKDNKKKVLIGIMMMKKRKDGDWCSQQNLNTKEVRERTNSWNDAKKSRLKILPEISGKMRVQFLV